MEKRRFFSEIENCVNTNCGGNCHSGGCRVGRTCQSRGVSADRRTRRSAHLPEWQSPQIKFAWILYFALTATNIDGRDSQNPILPYGLFRSWCSGRTVQSATCDRIRRCSNAAAGAELPSLRVTVVTNSLHRKWLRGGASLLVVSMLALAQSLSADVITESMAQKSVEVGLAKIDLVDLKRHVGTLASDALEGREAGGRGGKAAQAYLRSELKAIRATGSLPKEQTQEFGRDYQNLLLVIPGSDERLKQEVVIVGAHYDHVGYGNSSNSHGPFGQIHNGADDNASGTSAVLELIQAFASLPAPPARTVMFALWDAEEAGLLGSKHWVASPTLPLKDVRLVLNLDMLGRLREGRVVTLGWRSAAGLRYLLASQNVGNELRLAFQPRVTADSDHYPFYSSRVPIIHLDTDKHDDYHRPSDDADRIVWDGILSLTKFAFRVSMEAANRPQLPGFRNEAFSEPVPTWMTRQKPVLPQVRFGVNWNSELSKQNIAEISNITPDSPAARAGLKIGDRVVKVGPWESGSMDDLRTILQMVKNPVEVRVARTGSEAPLELSVNFWGTPIRLGAGWVEDPALPNSVVLTHVVMDSPADRVGLSAGDVIVGLNGSPIASSEEIRNRIMNESSPFQIRYERMGQIREVTIQLPGEAKSEEPTTQAP